MHHYRLLPLGLVDQNRSHHRVPIKEPLQLLFLVYGVRPHHFVHLQKENVSWLERHLIGVVFGIEIINLMEDDAEYFEEPHIDFEYALIKVRSEFKVLQVLY